MSSQAWIPVIKLLLFRQWIWSLGLILLSLFKDQCFRSMERLVFKLYYLIWSCYIINQFSILSFIFYLVHPFIAEMCVFRICNNLAQLYAKDITSDKLQVLHEALQREVNYYCYTEHVQTLEWFRKWMHSCFSRMITVL